MTISVHHTTDKHLVVHRLQHVVDAHSIEDTLASLRSVMEEQSRRIASTIEQVFLLEDLTAQAESVQELARYIHTSASFEMMRLGEILFRAEDRRLYSYLGYDSMDEWLEIMGISTTFAQSARIVYLNSAFCAQIGQPIEEIVRASPVQIQMVNQIRQETQSQVREQVTHQLKTGTVEQKQELAQQLIEQQKPEILASIHNVLSSRPVELAKERQKQAGGQKAELVLILEVDWQKKRITYSGSIPFEGLFGSSDGESDNDFEYIDAGYRVFFRVKGRDGLVKYQDLPEVIREVATNEPPIRLVPRAAF